jgi:hypothetical protein
MKRVFFAILFLFFLTTLSCKILKDRHDSNKNVNYIKDTITQVEKLQDKRDLIDSINAERIDYANKQVTFNSVFETNTKQYHFSGILRIQNNIRIWISIRPVMAIEANRILIEKDSIYILDRLNQSYYFGDYTYFKKKFKLNLSYDAIQSFLEGNIFFYPDRLSRSEYSINDTIFEGKEVALLKREAHDGDSMIHEMYVQKDSLLMQSNILRSTSTNEFIQIIYRKHKKFEEKEHINLFSIQGMFDEEPFICRIEIENVAFEKEMNFPFNVPKNYTIMKL